MPSGAQQANACAQTHISTDGSRVALRDLDATIGDARDHLVADRILTARLLGAQPLLDDGMRLVGIPVCKTVTQDYEGGSHKTMRRLGDISLADALRC